MAGCLSLFACVGRYVECACVCSFDRPTWWCHARRRCHFFVRHSANVSKSTPKYGKIHAQKGTDTPKYGRYTFEYTMKMPKYGGYAVEMTSMPWGCITRAYNSAVGFSFSLSTNFINLCIYIYIQKKKFEARKICDCFKLSRKSSINI